MEYFSRKFLAVFIISLAFNLLWNRVVCSQERKIFENRNYKSAPQIISFYDVSPTRNIIDLCGEWKYRKQNESGWKTIFIPACLDYVGQVIYKKEFFVPSNFKDRYFKLIAQGINHRSVIKVNDILIGNHIGGHTKFSFDIPESVIKIGSSNEITVIADNRYYKKNSFPYKPQVYGWKNYNGILREIYIKITPLVTIEDFYVSYNLNNNLDKAEFNVRFKIQNFNVVESNRENIYNNQDIDYYFELINHSTGEILYKSKKLSVFVDIQKYKLIDFDFQVDNPPIWDVDSPIQILCKVYLSINGNLVDSERLITGLRNLNIKNRRLLLNGNPINIIGVKRIESHSEYGSAFDYELMEKDVLKIKNIGINTVYTSYYPHHPYFYYLCDKYGILVLEEMPFWNISDKLFNNEEFIKNATSYFNEILSRDEHHPCIVFWGLMNNSQTSSNSSVKFIRKLKSQTQKTKGKYFFHSTNLYIDDVAYRETDLTIVDMKFLNLKDFNSIINSWKTKIPENKIFLPQFGKYLNKLDEDLNFIHEDLNTQAKFILDRYKICKQDKKVTGLIVESFSDWKNQVPILVNSPEQNVYIHTLGILDYYRNERPAYQILRKLIKNDEISSILSSNTSKSKPYSFLIWGFICILVLLFLLKKYRKFEDNIKKSIIYPESFFLDIRDRRLLSVSETIFIGLVISATVSLFVSSICYYYKSSLYFDYLVTDILSNSALKERFLNILWDPFKLLVFFTVFNFAFILSFSMLIHFLFIIFGISISIKNNLLIPIWSGNFILILLPLLMIFYSLLKYNIVLEAGLFIFLIVVLIYFFRMVKGYFVAFGYNSGKYLLVFTTFFVLLGLFIIILFVKSNLSFDYLRFLREMIDNRG